VGVPVICAIVTMRVVCTYWFDGGGFKCLLCAQNTTRAMKTLFCNESGFEWARLRFVREKC